ncbi:conserved hypothetical protein [Moraxellaceae bacterium 17A]|nr:conserved hypothetical protein [Moraxellaceae bacterium 17A]
MNKRTAKRIRQNNHRLYHESVKLEIKFKEAAKALPMPAIKMISRNIKQPTQLSMVKQFLKWDYKLVKCVVPISGGKDSQACLALAIKQFKPSNVIGLFCDTQFEHPMTYEHVAKLGGLYGVEIITRCGGSVIDQIEKRGRFPSFGARFCTNYLKTDVSKKFYKSLAEKQGIGFQVWYGMRTDESSKRAKLYADVDPFELYPPHAVLDNYPQYLEKKGVMFRLPIVDWRENEVYEQLGDDINPLYKKGFGRVGCFPCLAGGDLWKDKAFTFDDFGRSQREKVRVLEKQLGKSVFTSKGGQRRNDENQFCLICSI